MRHVIALLARDRSGSTLVEMAFALPVLVFLLGGVIEYGMLMNRASMLENAMWAGAQYAVTQPTDASGIRNAMTSATNLPVATVTATATSFCECPNGTTINCAATCAGPVTPYRMVSLQLTATHQPMIGLYGHMIPASVSRSMVVRAS
jgi:Flp pilus assembly protein TadG